MEKVQNNFYSENTLYLTSRGMLPIQDITEEDEIYYLDKSGKLKRTSNFNIISKDFESQLIVSGSHLYLETNEDCLIFKNNKKSKIDVSTQYNSIKISHNLQDIIHFDVENYQEVDINNRYYSITNLDRIILTFYFQNYFKYNQEDNSFEQLEDFSGKINYITNSCFYEYYGIIINTGGKSNNIKNTSDFISSKVREDLNLDIQYYQIKEDNKINILKPHNIINYLLNKNNLNYFTDIINRLEYFRISYEWSNKTHHQIYFYSYRFAVNFQVLLSLVGYKTYLRYDKNLCRFYIVYFNCTSAQNSKIKKVYSIEKQCKMYNIFFPQLDEETYIITANTDKSKETCISYNLSAFTFNDNENEENS